ncbi:PepSY-associated TM helix domain-containing protein [Ferrimonas sp. YFM]|uniref:PepSY-associated TM helix domain-containing protein n=1 Tax=Ferrimonas sp. YFM TaxID=3028878 RepID=UPI0025729623|nr:PepSY-associated TM helix domain-containing protein [Ferrimonas sp. YFM]BDY04097.1 hypothetical protein F0521_11380 [Ferrimonas sp. YFM]
MSVRDFQKQLALSHTRVGLLIAALLYILCLSGTLLVTQAEWERWQQPEVSEYSQLPAASGQRALDDFMEATEEVPERVWLVFPREEQPRGHLTAGDTEYWLEPNGARGPDVNEGAVHTLAELHTHLLVPGQLGITLVGILGVLMLGLTLSGLLSYRRLFKDAFRARFGSRGPQGQVDLHNRLSVWGLPFHLMIALTGAFFGVVLLLLALAVPLKYQGNQQALIDQVYGSDPVLDQEPAPVNLDRILNTLATEAPQASPIYLIWQDPNQRSQYIEVAASLPGRLIYSENYFFDTSGNYLGKQGMSDGPWGRQLIYSVYRLHFGHFGGLPIKLLYLVMGLSLTVVCVSGINLWLRKTPRSVRLQSLWAGWVWGTPLALVVAAAMEHGLGTPPLGVLLFTLGLTLLWASVQQRVPHRRLQRLLALGILALLLSYGLKHPGWTQNGAALALNLGMAASAFWLLWRTRKKLWPAIEATPSTDTP